MADLTLQEEKIIFQAAEDPEIRRVVGTHREIDRIKEVRRLLRERFPEVCSLPEHKTAGPYSLNTTAEFNIARMVVSLLK